MRPAPAVPQDSQCAHDPAFAWDPSSQSSRLVVRNRLLDLILGVHHKGAMLCDGLVQRMAGNQQCAAFLLGFEDDAVGFG